MLIFPLEVEASDYHANVNFRAFMLHYANSYCEVGRALTVSHDAGCPLPFRQRPYLSFWEEGTAWLPQRLALGRLELLCCQSFR